MMRPNATRILVGLTFLLILGIGTDVTAQTEVGVRFGALRTSSKEPNGLKTGPRLVGLTVGREALRLERWSLGAEAALDLSVGSGDTRNGPPWDMTLAGAYLTARTTDRFYVKGRVGLVYERISIDDEFDVAEDAIGLSLGAALGAMVADGIRFEISGTVVEEQMALLAIGLRRSF